MQLQLTVNYREFNVSLALKLVIPSYEHTYYDVSERNVCYLLIYKEDPLVLHRHPSHCKFFPRAVISSCAVCVI